MKKSRSLPAAKSAIITLAKIQAAAEAFDRGDTNVFDALDQIAVAIDAYRNAEEPHRDAA
jgi:hypothetical protein